MKKINLIWIIVLFLWGCDKGFEKLNQDPNNVRQKDFSPGYVFSTAELYTAVGEEETALYYGSAFVQQMASLSDVGIFNYQGDKYVYLQGPDEQLWKATYGSSGKLIQDVIQNTKDKPEFNNLYQMARIWKTMIYHRVTDMYGDIPYSDAGLAYYDQKYKPKYDAQKDIYANMLSELEDASSKLDEAQPNFASFDIVYGGNIARWKKLGYSMMLRLGMRLSKVDPSTAEAWVKKAYAGGVFSGNEDNAFIRGTDVTGAISYLRNGTSFNLTVSGPSFGKISKTYFDFMKNHNDPRLKYTVAVYKIPSDISTEDTDPNIQKGLPNGLNRYTLENDPSYDPSLPAQEHQYSGVKRNVYAKLDGPRMFITYPEMQFLLSEAAVREWITADAKQLYENGVTGAMKLLSQYDASATIMGSEIEDYLTANPFVGTGDKNAALEQINTQFWATTFLNGYEAYANVRRSGYPILVPVIYPDNETNGKFPRRLKYPLDERVLNADNYNDAVSRQGADEFLTPVWWDK
jgi:hypothetical protein